MSATKHNHMDNGAGGSHYYVPPEPKRWPSIGLAVGVHALLLAFLVIGVSWQNHEPVAVEAEVWDLKTQEAAPPPPPQPEPEPQPETPPPEPTPKIAPPPPPPPVEQPIVKQPAPPDIALEREKKRKEEIKKLKQQQAEEERQERERELAEQQRAEEKRAKALAEAQAKKQAAEQAKKEAAEQEKKEAAEQAKKEAAEQKKKDEADKKKKAEAEKKKAAAEAKKLEAARAEEMRRITGAAGNPGSTGTTGTAEKSTAPGRDTGYIAAITAKVKGNSSYSGDDPGNPVVSFHVEQLPTGEIVSVRKTKSSGIPAFDDAIERAIKASSPLPKKKDGTVARSLDINFKMKDMQ